MSIYPDTNKLSLPIDVLELNSRTYHILKRENVSTLSDVVNLGENGLAQIYQLGKKQVPYILDKLDEYMSRTLGMNLAEIQSKKTFLYTTSSSGKPNLVQEITPFIKVLLKDLKYQNDYEIIKRRYGLENSKSYTLQEVGDYFGISRERVRQLESRAERKILKTLTGSFESPKWQIPQNIIDETNDLFSLFREHDVVITEDDAKKIIQNRYGNEIKENELGSIRFLMSLAGLEALPKATRETIGISLVPAWVLLEKIDKPLLFKVLGTVYQLLLREVKPVSRFDIFVQVNGKLKKKVEPIYLEYATKICREIQKIDEDTYEFRFESLPSVADKAYRVLNKANKPLHIRDILREINHLQVKDGRQANVIIRTLQQQLGSDKRFEPIGKSGEWSLVEWEHITKETILELMQEYLHLKQTSATANEIFDYVCSKRESVKKNSIRTYLTDQKTLFTRVANGKYGLTAWEIKYVPSDRRRVDRAEITYQIETAIKTIFESEKTDKLPLWSVIESVRERTGRSAITIRNRLSELPYLDIEPHPTHPQRKYLKFLSKGQKRSVTSIAGQRPSKTLIRDNVQNEVENYLLLQHDNSAPLSVIASHVMKKTGCKKPTFYHYLSEMENIQKSYDDSILVCRLIVAINKSAPLSFPQIDTTTDIRLKDQLIRAVNNLNVDNVDLGLFQLGKIFESELRSFLTLVKTKNVFPVSNKDLGRLVDMINCIGNNGIITQKHHLTLLREQRNERAHGDVPNLVERKKLMQYAPFFGDLYIKYIILLNDKRQKLQ